ncbi:hypothetical protein KBI23_23760 [bacterium]|nr:hypothetical protein [bacterium]MBP9809481.1 hypothetical protein [bacterium]
MQKNSITIVLAFLAMLACPSALADGLIHDGHVNGPHTFLTLTKEQISSLAHGKDKITLTDSQRKTLEGLTNAGAVKELLVVPVTTNACTSDLSNVAVRTGKGSIEIADSLFGRDWAKQNKDQHLWFERRAEQQKALEVESLNATMSQEARLTLQGLAEKNPESERTINFYQSALRINPNYKWARRNLAESYSARGSVALHNDLNYEKASHYLELAIATADPTDQIFIESTKNELKIATSHKRRDSAR